MLTLIGVNTVFLACVWNEQSEELFNFIEVLNVVFSFIFILECVIKLIGFGFKYFKDLVNIVDFIIALSCIGRIFFI